MRRAGSGGGNRGQSLVETALTLPLLLLLALGVIDVGRAFYFKEAISNSARQAVRLAASASQQATGDSLCAGYGSGTVTATSPIPSGVGQIATIANYVALESSSDGTPGGSAIAGATLSITWHCTAGHAVTNSTNGGVTDPVNPASDAVSARITYSLPLVTPFFYPFTAGTFTLVAAASSRVDYR